MKPLFRTSIALLTLLLLVPMLVAADAPGAVPVLAPAVPILAPDDPTARDNPEERQTPDWSWAPLGFATTRSLYLLGQPVTFTYRNDTGKDVELPGGAPWVIEDEDGKTVLAPISTMILIYVRPGEAYGWTWNQKDGDGNQVEPGTYTVVLTTSAGTSRATFTIGSVKADPDAGTGQTTPPAPPAIPSSDLPFTDVTGADPADAYIAALKTRGVVTGSSSGMFEPDRMVTRAEFITMLLRAFDVEPLASDAESSFTGVSRDHWSFGYLAAAYDLNLIALDTVLGEGAGYAPDEAITRAEISGIISLALGNESAASELVGSQGSGMSPVTRREASVIIYNLMGSAE